MSNKKELTWSDRQKIAYGTLERDEAIKFLHQHGFGQAWLARAFRCPCCKYNVSRQRIFIIVNKEEK